VDTKITTLVSLHGGIKRIDFRTTLDNRCEDHRLRVIFNAPFSAPDVIVESAFDAVRRSTRVGSGEGCVEKPIGTGPQKTFSSVENGSVGMALFNRGIPEIEAAASNDGTMLALTLVRSVGWLSRDDLVSRPPAAGPTLEAPGAQSKGAHEFEYAFTSYRGDHAESGIAAQAHAYAFPPIAVITNGHKGRIKDGASLVSADNPNIVVSAVEPSRVGGAYMVRLYNATDRAQEVGLALWSKSAKVYEVNLLERKLSSKPLKRKGGRIELSFRPAEIRTLQVAPRR